MSLTYVPVEITVNEKNNAGKDVCNSQGNTETKIVPPVNNHNRKDTYKPLHKGEEVYVDKARQKGQFAVERKRYVNIVAPYRKQPGSKGRN